METPLLIAPSVKKSGALQVAPHAEDAGVGQVSVYVTVSVVVTVVLCNAKSVINSSQKQIV